MSVPASTSRWASQWEGVLTYKAHSEVNGFAPLMLPTQAAICNAVEAKKRTHTDNPYTGYEPVTPKTNIHDDDYYVMKYNETRINQTPPNQVMWDSYKV